jgi:hypothetical protein
MLARTSSHEAGRLARPDAFEDTGAFYPTKLVNNSFDNHFREGTMKNPLDSLWGTVIAGVVLLVVLYVFANNFLIVR